MVDPAIGQNQGAGKTLYRSGFQPKGVWRDRSEEFEVARMKREEGKRLEERRLGRRLEKVSCPLDHRACYTLCELINVRVFRDAS